MIRVIGIAALGLSFVATQPFAKGADTAEQLDAGMAVKTSDTKADADASDNKKRKRIGYGRMIQNDFIGDGNDRWRTGSVASSRVWGYEWDNALPETFGETLEFRINAEIIAPDNLVTPAAGDRPYAGSLSFGLHTHFQKRKIEYSVGVDMVLTGEETRLSDFQAALHDLLSVDEASDAVLDSQIDGGVHPTAVVELGHNLALVDGVALRPFVEARAGVETMVRAGADLRIGSVGAGELLVRDPVSGQRYRAVRNSEPGYSVVLGGDIAHVRDSEYLPESSGVVLTETRRRLRAGLHWQGEKSSVFYGVAWLGEEFEGQEEGQVVGSLRLNLDF
ncbi:lipid A-modifier LpxR family protein [Thalassobius sp. Cn5-15]|jgi:hypothetical protein|uniref:lipid A-modifier LpxR family protein n=1 Tax=Thalassobius sp. Cn5-15 TaxID=2917763 RepID=UPI001EF27673|nr:lipid A-modifier LpxR family protein [Thalassobius sp. Cn5-15]MCG7494166.1 lipid A deacylase LpxR family protein [Thalassobius sp. Cn5-15]